MDYVNPFAMYQNVNSVPNNPFYSDMMRHDFQKQATPFIDRMNQSGNMDLMKKGIETGEFASPEATQARMTGHQKRTAENQSYMSMQPHRDNAEQARLAAEIEALPYLNKEKIEKAKLMARQVEGTPMKELYATLGQLYDHMKDAKPEEQGFLYANAINRFQQTNPGVEIPPPLRVFRPDMIGDFAAIRHSQLFTPEQVGRERVQHIQGGYGENVANINANRAVDVANIQARAHVQGAQAGRESMETPQRAMARLRRQLRDDPNNEEVQREYSGYVASEFEQRFSRDPRAQMMAVQANSSPEKAKEYEMFKEWAQSQYMEDQGIKRQGGGLGFDEFKWATLNFQDPRNAHMSFEEIVAEGRKRGKIKSRAKK